MSIAGYLDGGRPGLRLPKKSGDELDAKFDGAVLAGEKTVEELLAGDAIRPKMAGDEYYQGVEDYDAVLRAHCRL